MKSQAGFTLIEATVVGIISVIIPAVIITMLRLSNSELSSGSTQANLIADYAVVSEDIHRASNLAAYVVQGPTGPASCPGANPVPTPQAEFPYGVVFCDAAGAFFRGFQFSSTGMSGGMRKLEERSAGETAWKTFRIGRDSIVATSPDPSGPKTSGYFSIYDPDVGRSDGPGLRFSLVLLKQSTAGTWDTLAMQTESVICRNVVPTNYPTWLSP